MNNKNKILIIEDDQMLMTSIKEALEDEKAELLEATDGMRGLEMAQSIKPQLILLDLNLPLMYGLTVMQKIREEGDDWGKNVPIIIITNQNTDNKILESIVKYNPSYYLLKADLSLATLVENVRKCLDK